MHAQAATMENGLIHHTGTNTRVQHMYQNALQCAHNMTKVYEFEQLGTVDAKTVLLSVNRFQLPLHHYCWLY